MFNLEEFAAEHKGLSQSQFVQKYQHPFFVRELAEEERSGLKVQTAYRTTIHLVTESPSQESTPITGSFKAITLESLATPAPTPWEERLLCDFMCYPICKSPRNSFPKGVTIGRTRNNDLVISLPSISKFHCWLSTEKNALFAYDADSRFGSFVDGVKLPSDGQQGLMITPGKTLTLGEVALRSFDAATLYRWIKSLPGERRRVE